MPNKFGKRDKFEVIPYPDIDFSPLNETSNGHTTNTHSDINQNGGIDTGNDIEPRGDHFRCGYFRWQPDWLQRCNNPRMLLAAICWFTFTQGHFLRCHCTQGHERFGDVIYSFVQSHIYIQQGRLNFTRIIRRTGTMGNNGSLC